MSPRHQVPQHPPCEPDLERSGRPEHGGGAVRAPSRPWCSCHSSRCATQRVRAKRVRARVRPVIRQALPSMDDDNAGRVASVGSYIGGFVCAAGWYVYMAMALKAGQHEYEWECKTDPKDLPAHVSAIAPCGFTSGAYLAPGILMSLGVVMLSSIFWLSRSISSSVCRARP